MARLVYGLGDPVLDIVARVGHAFLHRLGATPGGCVQVTGDEMAALLALPEVQASMLRVPGGSAANVMKGLASLAGAHSLPASSGASGASSSSTAAALAVLFVGMVGRDEVAEEYRRSIAAHGVQPLLLQCAAGGGDKAGDGLPPSGAAAPTATCLCLVTPDGQRTMRTSLGAALQLQQPAQLPEHLRGQAGAEGAAGSPTTPQLAEGCLPPPAQQNGSGPSSAQGSWALLHCEGYCLYRPAVTAAAMRAAHAAGARVSLDLASFEVIANCWGQLDELLQERLVDVVFCNEQEAEALCKAACVPLPDGATSSHAVSAAQSYLLSRGASTVVVSRGSKGCIVRAADGGEASASAGNVKVVDTVGAGDFFTAGFLFAMLSGASLEACARSGCAAGTAAVQVAGAQLGQTVLQQLQSDIGGILAADGSRKLATCAS